MKFRIVIIVLIAMLVGSQVYVLNVVSDLTNKLEVKNKFDPNATSNDILLIGNSIFANCDWGKKMNMSNIFNSAVSGLTLFEANQFPSTFVNRKSKKIVIELGINDLNTTVPTKMVVYAGVAFLGLVKKISPNSEVYVMSVLPLNETLMKGKSSNKEISEYNFKISSWAKNNHMQYIDAYSVLLDERGQLNQLYTIDGLHLNEIGYSKLASVLKPYF